MKIIQAVFPALFSGNTASLFFIDFPCSDVMSFLNCCKGRKTTDNNCTVWQIDKLQGKRQYKQQRTCQLIRCR